MKKIILVLVLLISACSSMKNQYYSEALKLVENGNYEEAIILFEKAISIDEKNVEIYRSWANAYYELDDIGMAIEVLYQGYEKTEDESLNELIEDYGESLNSSIFDRELETICIADKDDFRSDLDDFFVEIGNKFESEGYEIMKWRDTVLTCVASAHGSSKSIYNTSKVRYAAGPCTVEKELPNNYFYKISKNGNYIEFMFENFGNDMYITIKTERGTEYNFECYENRFVDYKEEAIKISANEQYLMSLDMLDNGALKSISLKSDTYGNKDHSLFLYYLLFVSKYAEAILTMDLDLLDDLWEIDGYYFVMNRNSSFTKDKIECFNEYSSLFLQESLSEDMKIFNDMFDYIGFPINDYINLSEAERILSLK